MFKKPKSVASRCASLSSPFFLAVHPLQKDLAARLALPAIMFKAGKG